MLIIKKLIEKIFKDEKELIHHRYKKNILDLDFNLEIDQYLNFILGT